LHVHPIYCEHNARTGTRKLITPISNVVAERVNSPTDLSSEEATELAKAFREVPLPRQIPPQCLTPLVVRPYPVGLARVSVRTRGPDFWFTPSSVDREFSPAWNCVITPRITLLVGSQISGRETIAKNRCALRWFEYSYWTNRGRSKRYDGRFTQSEAHSVRFAPDIPPCGRREQVPSERAPHHPGFGVAISGLHHEPVDARWEHYSVHQSEPTCQSSDACRCPLVEIDGDALLTTPAIACTSVPWPHAPSWVEYFPRWYQSGRREKGSSKPHADGQRV